MAATANRLTDYGPLTDGIRSRASLRRWSAARSPIRSSSPGADAAGPVEIHRRLCVALERSRACRPHLESYATRTGRPLDERRLRAHRLRARLATVACRLRKGRLSAGDAAATVADLGVAARER